MQTKRFMVAFIALVATLSASAAPFGLNPGDSLEAIGRIAKLNPTKNEGIYSAPSLPQGHPDLDDYRLTISPTVGLCKVSAFTPPKPTSVYGEQIRSDFEKWQEALTSKYGAPKKYDFLRQGSIWKDPKDFTMALSRQERTLAAYWIREDAKDGISTIKLEAFAAGPSMYMINVGYDLDNVDACLKSLASKKNANL